MVAEGRVIRLALAGDTMLGRGVARAIGRSREPPLAPEVVAVAAEADLFVLNLECCISDRGQRWRDPAKPFFFRAPPLAAELLAEVGVDCVTLANNHAAARAPRVLAARGMRLAVLGASDHPATYAAGADRCGIAYADLHQHQYASGGWLSRAVLAARGAADAVLVTPHWGANMTLRPPSYVRRAAHALLAAGATLVAGHSAHVVHGAERRVVYDLGDFVDDYAVDPRMRNDLGLLFLVELDVRGPRRLEAVPLKLDYCRTRLARDEDAGWIRRRFIDACAELGTPAVERDDRVVLTASQDPV
jgi:poly-gamma-glutamate synthesis protein (capsule biosynthesis protein)